MQVIVFASTEQKEQWSSRAGIHWIQKAQDFLRYPAADAFVDLMFENTEERKALLQQLLPKVVLVNSVATPLAETDPSFVRFNGWPGFLSSPLIEAACLRDEVKQASLPVFTALGKQPEWLPDEPGFVSARVVSMIINEAYLTLAEGVSTKEEINTAMKLGTAYPYGPFEWAEKIGRHRIVALLQRLAATQAHYSPAPLLVTEAAR